MTGIVDDWVSRLGKRIPHPEEVFALIIKVQAAEIGQLRADKAAISQTASDYLHEIGRLRAENLVLAVTR
jgi:hypothetical protein